MCARRDGNDQSIRTKGDNNPVDDVGLYRGPKYLKREDMIGKVQGYVPYVGYVTIMMVSSPSKFLETVLTLAVTMQNDFPKLKYALLAILGGTILLHRE